MVRFPRFIHGLLVLVLVLLTSCSQPPATVATPPTYTPAQLERVHEYVDNIQANYERMSELQADLNRQDWQAARATLRGPLGQMLQDMRNLERNLLPADQKLAHSLNRAFAEDLLDIDGAADQKNLSLALRKYDAATADFAQFLQALPQG
uniref:Photosystem II protein PsbQ n=1 Tax=Cyanothece sp. (strain PCC 7425 / ATCC 29141) TaxID=395961 RepID=B8HRG3_CYAP4